MLKKLSLLVMVLLVASSSQVIAQTPSTASPTAQQTVKDQLKNLRDQRKTAVEQLRTDAKNAREEFKSKIAQIKDERKKLIVAKIDDHVASSNAKLTTKMTSALTRISAILASLKDKASALKTAGKDTGAVDAAILAAETAISNAQTAVTAQAGKSYSANITTDPALKGAIGQMFSRFRQDIMAAHKAVNDARQAVMKVLSEVAKLGGLGDPNASQSAGTNTQL